MKIHPYCRVKLETRLKEKGILLLDGAMGTELEKHDPQPSDYPGGHVGFNDGLNTTHPEWIRAVHASYLQAGSDCIATNTFGSSRIKLDEYGMGGDTERLNYEAAVLARDAANQCGRSCVYVLGSMGPSGYLPSMPQEKEISLDDLQDSFYEQVRGLCRGGVDGIILETGQDILELKTMITAVRQHDASIPIIASITFAQPERMLPGTPVQAAYYTVAGMQIDAFGINCSTGPAEMMPAIAWLEDHAGMPVCVYPNAGIPDMSVNGGAYPLGAQVMADMLDDMLQKHARVRLVGGCCGTTPEHIRLLRGVIDRHAPVKIAA